MVSTWEMNRYQKKGGTGKLKQSSTAMENLIYRGEQFRSMSLIAEDYIMETQEGQKGEKIRRRNKIIRS